MSKVLKAIKHFLITVLLFCYFTVIIFFSVILLNRNEFGVTQFGDKVLINITNKNSTNMYRDGDLVILKTVNIEDIKENDEVFIYRIDTLRNTVNIVVSDVAKISLENSPYLVLKNDNLSWGEKYIAGVQYKTYRGVGRVISFFQSKWIFFFLLIVPCFAIFLYEVFMLIVSIKYDHHEIQKQDKVSNISNTNAIEEKLREEINSLQQQVSNMENRVSDASMNVSSVPTVEMQEGNHNIVSTNEVAVSPILNCEDDIEVLEMEYEEDEPYEEIDVPFISSILPEEDIEDQILNHLSRISVDVGNNHNLAEMGGVVEEEEEVLEESKEETNNTPEPKEAPVLKIEEIGKNEVNFVKKVVLIKEKEVMEFVKLIYEKDGSKAPITLLKRMVCYYVKDKYVVPIDYTEQSLKYCDQLLVQNIKSYPNRIKNGSVDSKKKALTSLLIYNEFDKNYTNLAEVLKKYFGECSEDEFKMLLKIFTDKVKKFKEIHREFTKKISSKMFELQIEQTKAKDVFNTKICSNLKFSKIFSEWIINKSYHENVVLEQLEEVQIKLLSAMLLQQLLDSEFTNKYLIYLHDSVFTKERRIKSLLNNINDPFSQAKILILVKKNVITDCYDVLKGLKGRGYHFAVELTDEEIRKNDVKKPSLLLCDYIFIKGHLTEEERSQYIPIEGEDKVYYIHEALIEEVVIKS